MSISIPLPEVIKFVVDLSSAIFFTLEVCRVMFCPSLYFRRYPFQIWNVFNTQYFLIFSPFRDHTMYSTTMTENMF